MRSPFLSLQFGLEPKSIGIMRLGLGLALIYDLADRWSEIEAWQTDFGVLPRVNLIEAGYYRPSLHVASGQAWFQMLLHCVHFAAAVALTLGYRTQLAAVSCWLLTVSLQNRNPLVRPPYPRPPSSSRTVLARTLVRRLPAGAGALRRRTSPALHVPHLLGAADLARDGAARRSCNVGTTCSGTCCCGRSSSTRASGCRSTTSCSTTKPRSRSSTTASLSHAASAWRRLLCTRSCGPSTSAGTRPSARAPCIQHQCASGWVRTAQHSEARSWSACDARA